jgi:hypothetical protein
MPRLKEVGERKETCKELNKWDGKYNKVETIL